MLFSKFRLNMQKNLKARVFFYAISLFYYLFVTVKKKLIKLTPKINCLIILKIILISTILFLIIHM